MAWIWQKEMPSGLRARAWAQALVRGAAGINLALAMGKDILGASLSSLPWLPWSQWGPNTAWVTLWMFLFGGGVPVEAPSLQGEGFRANCFQWPTFLHGGAAAQCAIGEKSPSPSTNCWAPSPARNQDNIVKKKKKSTTKIKLIGAEDCLGGQHPWHLR